MNVHCLEVKKKKIARKRKTLRYKFLEPQPVSVLARGHSPCYEVTYLGMEFRFSWYPGPCHPNPGTVKRVPLRQENNAASDVLRFAHRHPQCQSQALDLQNL